jgi:nitroreductase
MHQITTEQNQRRTIELSQIQEPVINSWKYATMLHCAAISKKKSKDEAHINAKAKMDKWKNIGGYIVVCVGDQPSQDDEYPYKDFSQDHDEDFEYWYDTVPIRAPQTERQLEDYSSGSASIQNILLSIHSEDFGAKWATGPMIRCRATRSLIGCKETDAIAGLIMIGDSKVIPREWRRRREFDGDVMREL